MYPYSDQKTQKNTISDIDGKFSLEARIGNMLKISYIGYRTVTLAAAKDMRVVMSEDNMKLDEVVVVAYLGVPEEVNLTARVVASVKKPDTSNSWLRKKVREIPVVVLTGSNFRSLKIQ